MCGIIGYVGTADPTAVVLDSLSRLEYRGYDSAGLALVSDRGLRRIRRAGQLAELKKALTEEAFSPPDHETPVPTTAVKPVAAIGHTRWATHGAPTTGNAHPQTDCREEIAVAHNGIVENWAILKKQLEERGHRFRSETDTEVLAHLLEEQPDNDLLEAVRLTMEQVEGSVSMVVVHSRQPGRVVGTRRGSPLVVGWGEEELYLASATPAFGQWTNQVTVLENDQVVEISPGGVTLLDSSGRQLTPEIHEEEMDTATAEREGYPSFMLKEIHEQPRAITETLRGRFDQTGAIIIRELGISAVQLSEIDKVFVVGCGTSFHAGLVAKYGIERWTRLPVELDIASEFRYRDPVVDARTLVIGISQSGETADTLAAMEYAQSQGALTLGVCNVVQSSLSRLADGMLYTRAGAEIGVAATKTFTTALVILELFGLHLAQVRGSLEPATIALEVAALRGMSEQIELLLADTSAMEKLAQVYRDYPRFFFLGRSADMPIALEATLKLKEIAYVGAEGYPAGEMKHGPIALVEEGVLVIGVSTDPRLRPKTMSNLAEMASRGAEVILIATEDADPELLSEIAHTVLIPVSSPMVAAGVAAVPLQLLAYFLAVELGHDVDKPRNLAKTVTVE